MHQHVLLYIKQGLEAYQKAFSPVIIIEDQYLQTFVHTLIAFGFLFVILFYRSGSLLPCIIPHSVINILSAFSNETGLTVERRIAFILIKFIIIAIYVLILTKTLPEK